METLQPDVTSIAVAFVLGVMARMVSLPPLVGYLIAGFVLYAAGVRATETLYEFAEIGITLLLFSIGLKLRLSSLVMPQIWAVASLHMVLTTALIAAAVQLFGLTGLSLLAGLDPQRVVVIAFALSFSSTVFAVKVLEEKGEMGALYGRVAIGILIMQDIAAVVFLAASTGRVPSPWALLLLAGLLPLRHGLGRVLERIGHGELLVLFGLVLALGGARLFEAAGIKGDLGALVLGLLLARHPRSSELGRHLLGFKDLFLIGFFLTIGLSGPVSLAVVGLALLLLVLVPIKMALYFGLLTRFRLRARSALLTSFSLANYSEFGLIVVAIAVGNGWLDSQWLIVIAIALAVSFIAAAPLNMVANALYSRYRGRLLRYEQRQPIAEEQPIEVGDASVLVFGMGRVGTGAYDHLRERIGDVVVGVDLDHETVEHHKEAGRRVILGSATDPDFWARVRINLDRLKLVMLAMPVHRENLNTAQQLREMGYRGRLAAIAKYPDEVTALEAVGVDLAFNLYAEAGTGFAETVCRGGVGDIG